MPSLFPQTHDEISTARFIDDAGALTWRSGHEVVRIEAWGPDALRVRAGLDHLIEGHGALAERPAAEATVKIDGERAQHHRRVLTAEVDAAGQIRFLRADTGEELLGRAAHPLLVARPPQLHRHRQRLSPHRAVLRRLRGRAALRPGPAHPRPAGPKRHRGRPGAAQRRGEHPLRRLQPRLRPALEQPGRRPGRARGHRHPLGRRTAPARSTTGSPPAPRHRSPRVTPT